MTKALYVAWQNPRTRKWFTVGVLRRLGSGTFEFRYTKGAKFAGNEFLPFGRFRDLGERYLSSALFPLFANRTLPESKTEHESFLSWLGLSHSNSADPDPVEVLSRSGGPRATDSLEIFPLPEPNENGKAELEFFVHGVRYVPPELHERLGRMREGERLFLMFDVQNPVDPKAVAVRSADPPIMLGYCPRYLAHDLRQLLRRDDDEEVASLSVLRVNRDAPLQYRLLCRLTAIWYPGFRPCSSEEFEPLSRSDIGEDAVQDEYAYASGNGRVRTTKSQPRKGAPAGRKKSRAQNHSRRR